MKPIRIVCISDTHGLHEQVEVPDGDLLLHAGDFTNRGELSIVKSFNDWLGGLPHPHKVVIAGNHDFCFENKKREKAEALITNAVYLRDSMVQLAGFNIYGSPWQPWFHSWAFNVKRGPELAAIWEKIPAETDILVTHGPAKGLGGLCIDGREVGDEDLLYALDRVQPMLHVCGHIHEAYGRYEGPDWIAVNASCNTFEYNPINPAIVLELEPPDR